MTVDENPSPIAMHEGWFTIRMRVSPNAGRTAIKGVYGDSIKIGLAAPPVDGAANDALIAYLAKKLKVKKRSITIISGQSSKNKKVRIDESVDENFMAEQLGLSEERKK